ncbi:glycerophosphodiester phosphodiesterase [Christensenellaceae bacterium OttesenSCG-928-L17]|nr:glycerophosphodiester phosphodiesterase [Christensenellaceae bacterium OttesenSCG-928-L17]
MLTEVWAHRGASAYAPENTLEAFEKAIRMGADGVELDVHMSADGQIVVIHDETVDRTSNGRGRVVDQPLAALKTYCFSNGMEGYAQAKIPTLQEVYELIRPTGLVVNVEMKCDVIVYWGMWGKLIALEREMGMQNRVLYSSFNHYALRELSAVDPQAQIGLLYGGAVVDPWVYANYMHARAIHPHYRAVLGYVEMVAACREKGVEINPWTVDDPAAMQELCRAGVHALITNKPDVARGIVNLQSER